MEREKKLEAFGRLLDIMDRLRAECPWDREQTFASLRNNTIEETFELADAIAGGNPQEICGELGDLLLHVVFYSKLGDEAGAFDIGAVCNAICDKLIYRHPHVFGNVEAENPNTVKQNWEQLKLKERGEAKRHVLSGVPRSLPAMVKAYRISEKAASAGFDWERREDVWAKVREELEEMQAEMDSQEREGMSREFGDLLFALINAARLYGIDPEGALEATNRRFIERFNYLEERIERQGGELKKTPLEEMEALWQEAKRGMENRDERHD